MNLADEQRFLKGKIRGYRDVKFEGDGGRQRGLRRCQFNMSRKQTITKEKLLDSAFELVREKGSLELSARHLAERAQCSTQPIFRIYTNMAEMEDDLFLKCVGYFSDFFTEAESISDVPFVNFGMNYINFAKKEPHLFRLLFLESNRLNKSSYDIVNGGKNNFVIREIRRIPGIGPDEAESVFMKVWLFIHGIACMVIRDDFDISETETISLLMDMFRRIYGRTV